ncbi:MAG: hypothetical protein Unbinned4336contig1001_30 [Prokaryotic dsDNA virus sp.]|nr:MAG: hypothetical protein Unbinned4336contig1001_30 [Prokaryotic dsDNA virus sp.]|tara:strand:- start:1051 stop:1263 length:213 start_codon:yes stop_codon:yes gene_type:complete
MNNNDKQLIDYGLISMEGAAEIIGVTRRTVDKWIAEGKIQFNSIKLGRGPTCQILLPLKEVKKAQKTHGL